MSPVRKENPASHFLVLRRKILNLNFNLDMSYAIPSSYTTNTMLENRMGSMSYFSRKKENLRNIFSTFVDY